MAVPEINAAQFDAEVNKSPLPVLVDFYMVGSGPCLIVSMPVIEEIATERAGRLKVVKCNVSASWAIASRFGIKGVPYLFLFKDGQPIASRYGPARKPELLAWLDAALHRQERADRFTWQPGEIQVIARGGEPLPPRESDDPLMILRKAAATGNEADAAALLREGGDPADLAAETAAIMFGSSQGDVIKTADHAHRRPTGGIATTTQHIVP